MSRIVYVDGQYVDEKMQNLGIRSRFSVCRCRCMKYGGIKQPSWWNLLVT